MLSKFIWNDFKKSETFPNTLGYESMKFRDIESFQNLFGKWISFSEFILNTSGCESMKFMDTEGFRKLFRKIFNFSEFIPHT